jgi:large repetitive protein
MRITTFKKKCFAFVIAAAGLSGFQAAWAQAVCTPLDGGTGAVIAGTNGSKIISIDVTTGKFTQVADVTSIVPAGGINSVANNPNNSLVYFTSNSGTTPTPAKSIYFYNLVTGASGTLIADVTVAGTGITVGTTGMSSGSAFYDIGTNSLFIGVERPQTNVGGVITPYNSTIYRIPLNAAGTGTTGAAVVVTNDTTNWGDIVISGGNLHSFGTNPATGALLYKRYTVAGVADPAGTLDNGGINYQAAFDRLGNVKVISTANNTIGTYNVTGSPAGGLVAGSNVAITSNGTTAPTEVNNDSASCTPAIATIGDTVWADLNGDGVKDAGEAGIGGVTVQLYSDINGDGIVNGTDALLGTTTTDSAGLYSFGNVLPGQYTVKTVPGTSPIVGLTQTNPGVGGANSRQATINKVGGTDLTADFGYRVNADLQITKTNNATAVNAGGTTSYDIVVTNAGPDTVLNAVVTDPAVAGLSKTSATCTGTSCPAAAAVTTAALEGTGIVIPSLASGASVTFTVAANVTATTGSVANAATITGPLGHFDPTPANNSVTDTDPVTPVANLSITKTDGVSSITAGGTSVYTILVSNAGPSAANNAIFTDPAVTGLNVSSVTCGTPTGSAVCPVAGSTTVALMQGAGIVVPTLPSGGSVTFTVTGTVAANAPSPLDNVANVAPPAGTTDPTPGNNSATDSNTVQALAGFTCDGTFYQTRASGTETSLLRFPSIGPGAASATSVWTTNAAVGLNGLAFNPNDNFLYAFRTSPNTNTRDLYKLGTTNEALAGTIVDASLTNTFVITGATFDSQGRLFFIGQGTGGIAPAAVYRVDSLADSDPGTPGVQIAVAQIYPLSAATPNVGDFAFGPDGNLYGATGANVYQFLLSGGTATVSSRTIPTVGGIGSAFFDQNNRFYVYENGTSKLYQVTFSFGAAFVTDPAPATSVLADTIPYSPPPALPATIGATDGASCTPKVVNVSGQVWQDPNNSITIDGGELGTNASSSTLTVYAVDSAGNVVSKATVAANGTYTLVGVPANTAVTLRLSNDATVTVGNPAPTVPSLPTGWVNTGENKNGTTETTTPGEIALTTGITNVPNQDFGIEQPPVPTSATNSSIPANAGPTTLVTGLAATDPDGTVSFFKVDSLPPASEGVLYYADGVTPVLLTDPPFTPAVAAGLKFDPSGTFTGNSSFTFSAIDNAGKTSLTPATYTIPVNTPVADLSITKTDSATSVNAGGTSVYTIVVSNAGPSAADGAIFADPAITGLNVSSVTCGTETGGAVCSTPGNTTVALMQGAGIVIPTLPSGGSVTFTVNATVAGNAPSPLVNAATVITPVGVSDPTDPTRTGAGNNGATDSNTVQPVANLSITKTDNVASVDAGGNTNYTIVVSNAGPSAADGAIFADPAVTGLTASSVTCGTETGGAVCSTPGNTTVALMQGAGIVIPTLPSGGTVTFTVAATVAGNAPSPLVNAATVITPVGTSDPDDPTRTGAGNNGANDSNTVQPVADVSVVKTGPGTVTQGGAISYTIVVSNAGPSAADNTIFTDPAVSGLSISSVTCGTETGSAVCPTAGNTTVALMQGTGIIIPTLPSGGSVTFTVGGTVTGAGSITNTATALPPVGTNDPNDPTRIGAGNNSSAFPTNSGAVADLAVTKTNNVATVDAGGTTSYTIVVTNNGPSAANNAVVTDPAVAGLSKTAVTCGTPTGGAVCPASSTVALLEGTGIVIPTLPSGGSVTLTVNADVTATTGSVTNVVNVAPPALVTDNNNANDSANDNDPVNPRADLSVTKTNAVASVDAGGTTSYTIVVSNAGPSAANNAVVTDAAVAGLSKTAVTCGTETGGAACSTAGNTTVALLEGTGIIIPTLPSGGSVTLTVAANVTATTGTVNNIVSVTPPTGTTDPSGGNNTANDNDPVNPVADLSITKTDSATSVNAGGTSTYTIVVSNAGPSAADNAIFTDPAVTGLNVSSVTCGTETGGAVCSTPANTTIALMQGAGIVVPTLPSGGTVTYTVNATVAANAPSPLVNAATIVTPVGVNDPTDPTRTGAGNNTASDSNTVQPVADLSITKTDGGSSVSAGGASTYTIVVSNAGPSAADGAIFADPAVTGLNVSSVTCGTETGGAVCSTPGNTTVSLMQGAGIVIPTLPSGGTVTFTVAATVAGNAPSPLINIATVVTPIGTNDPTDPTRTGAGNNSASDSNTVQPVANLSITKTDGVSSVNAGGTSTYTIVVSNAGPSAANNAIFTDPAVTGLNVSSVTCGSETGGAVCSTPGNTTVALMQGAGIVVPTLPSGGTVTYTVTATVAGNAPSPLVNAATVITPVGVSDPDDPTRTGAGNNGASDSNTVQPIANLSITKTDGVASIDAGGNTTYTIVVANAGPSAANNAIFKDAAVSGLSVSSVTCGTETGGAVCSTPANTTVSLMQGAGIVIPTLPSGGSVTYTVNASVTAAGGSVANVATIDPPAGVTDPTPGDNTATDTNPVNPRADLGIVKSNSATSLVAGTATTYTLTVTNAGPSPANNALVTDPAVAGLTKTAVTCGSATGGAVCPASSTVALLEGTGIVIPTLPAGGSMVFTVNADVTATTGNIANVATIAPPAGITDPTPGNDSSTNTLPVTKVADVRVQKTGPLNVLQGDPISYTVVVTNDGPSDANNTVVTDPAVAGLNITGVTCGTPTGGAVCPAGVTVTALQGAGITIATLPSTGSLTFTVTGTVTGSGSITNTAKAIVPSDVTDPTDPTRTGAGNNTGASTTNGGPTADLQLVKTNGVASVDAGGTTTYTLTVTNNGPSAANNALVTDPAVTGLSKTAVTCGTPTGGAACPASSTVALLEGTGIVIPTLPSGGSLVFTVNADVTATTGSVANVATIAPPTGVTDPTPGNNTGTDTDPVNPRADLQLVKTNGGSSLTAGGTTTYTLTITNNGPSAANNALVTDPAVAGLNVTGVTCGSAAGSAVCPTAGNTTVALLQSTGIVVPTLPAGGSMVFTVNAGVTATTGSVTNSASINPPAGVTDPTPGNNTGDDTDTVNPQADLVVTKTDNQTTVDAGGTTTYTIVVTNNGPSAADNAVFTDPAVTGLSVSSVTCGTPVGGAVCSTAGNTTVALMQGTGIVIPTLPNGGSVTFTVAGTVAGDAPSPLVNTATIAPPPGVTDPTPGNNNGGDSSNVQPVADISVTKTDGATSVNAGGAITYTIVVSNAGPSAANNAVFSDPAVAGLTVTGVTCGTPTGGAVCPATSTVAAMQGAGITIPTLPANSSVTFTVTGNVAVGAASPLVNTAKAITPPGVNDPTDPTRTGAGNNSGSDSNTINPPGGITVKVYVDRNRNSTDEPTDPGLAGVTVEVRNSSNVVVATGVTDASGNVSFPTLPAGDYTVVETQPAGYGSSQNPLNSVPVTVATGTTQTVKFGETASTLAGKVYRDDNNDGTQQAGEPSLAGVTVTLTPAVGAPIVKTTASDGSYSFIDLPAGTYTVTETQPVAYNDGQAIAGSVAGTPGTNTVTGIVLPVTTDATGYDFTERGTTLNGTVFNDRNRLGTQDPGDAGIGGVTVTLTGTDVNGNPVSLTTTTAPDGTYSFPNLPAGTYTVTETQPTGYGSSATSPNVVTPVTITAGTTPAPVNFADTTSTLAGTVYNDANNNGAQNAGETGIQGVTVTLTGTDANGAPVTKTTTTDVNGKYSFIDLLVGSYTITETQPTAFNDGIDTNGTPAATGPVTNDSFVTIPVTAGIDGTGYLFGETGTPITGQVYKDVNRDSSNTGDPGIAGVPITLTGTTSTGTPVSLNTVTDANGNYSFPPQPAGTYTITETQPAGYGSSQNPSNAVVISVTAGTPVPPTNFGDTVSSLAGNVYNDKNNNGVQDAGELGIAGVTVTVTGTDANGAVTKTATTDSSGKWIVNDLLSGSYAVAETQPTAYNDGKDAVGLFGATPTGTLTAPDSITAITVPAGQPGTGYNFGERGTTITGTVFNDQNKNTTKDGTEPPLAGVTVTLTGTDANGNPVSLTTTTAPDGTYSFPDVPAGDYTVTETQPTGFGSSTPNAVPVKVTAGTTPAPINFADTLGSLKGTVYNDANNDGIKDPLEAGIAGVTVTLTGTDAAGNPVNVVKITGADGSYSFPELTNGTYTITETQPAAFNDGKDTNGTPAATGAVTNDSFVAIPLTAGTDGTGYLFGETGTPITGRVYKDVNANSVDNGEPGIAGVTVTLTGTTSTGTPVSLTTTTAADGSYSFPNVPAGSYTITETQPAGYGSSQNSSNAVPISVTAGTPVPATNFGETTGAISGLVFNDANNDGSKQATENGLPGVTVTLTGKDVTGATVNKTATTDASGNYSFTDLLVADAAGYTVTETQATGYSDGKDAAGNAATPGTATNGTTPATQDTITGVNITGGQLATGYTFGERGQTITGAAFLDKNKDGTQQGTEPPLAGVTVTLTGTDANGNPVSLTTTTKPDGTYSFPDVPAGNYTVTETQPVGYGSSATSPNAVPVTVFAGTTPAPINFADTLGTLTGAVYNDANNDGIKQPTEAGLAGVTVTLTGTNANGAITPIVTTSDSSGNYSFPDLLAGTYTITETQPAAFNDGKDTVGTIGGIATGTLGNDVISSITLPAGADGKDYLFGETGTPITGRVYKDVNANGVDNGEPGIAGVTVTLKGTTSTGTPVDLTTTTDANGNYSFSNVPAGIYTITETQPAGYGSSQNPSNAVPITVTSGTPVPATNFGETTGSLVGKVYRDDNNDGIRDGSEFGIAGVTVTLTGTGPTGAAITPITATTDANGNYSFPDLLSGNYTITETQPVNYSDGKDTNGTPAPTGTVTNDSFVSIPLTPGSNGTGYLFGERGTAISGVVYNDQDKNNSQQPGEPGLGNVLVTLKAADGVTDIDSDPNLPGIQPTTTRTDGDGQYSFPNLPAGTYTVVETQPAGTGSSENNTNSVPVILTNGVPKTVNFGDTFSSISGQTYLDVNGNGLKDTGEVGIGGVTVTLTGTDANGAPVNQTATTAPDGTYSFKNLTTGTYTITETQPAGYTDGAETNGIPAGNISVNDVISGIAVTTPATDATGYLFGETGTPVAGRVYVDTNNNGVQDPGEPGIPGQTVTLTPVGGGAAIPTTTDANGNYNFPGVPAGDYTITESQPTGYGSSTPNSVPVTVKTGLPTPLTNFGDTPTNIAGKVFRDDNDNGIQDGVEPGIAGVTVTVTGTDAKGAVITKTATTDATGAYAVNNLLSGTYTVTETQPTTYTDGKDTNGLPAGTLTNDTISSIVFADGKSGVGYNFGELGTSINGTVFVDGGIKDGIQQAGEPGKPGVTVTLKDKAGNVVATTITGPDGSYSFPNLPAGDYTIEETQPNGLGSSTPNIVAVPLVAGTPGTANFGDTLGSFTGTVYNDANDNGLKDAGETGIAGVTVTLTGTDVNGLPVTKTTTSDANGIYSFPDLVAGNAYTITETQPTAYTDGKDANGTPAGTLGNDVISSIPLTAGTAGTGYLFGEKGTPITGTVYVDANNDKTKQPGEAGIPGVLITLTGTTSTGTPVNLTTTTLPDGTYSFPAQPAGDYTITESQPAGYGSSENPLNSVPVKVTAGTPVPATNFGETTGSLTGKVFRDDNNNGTQDTGEPGIAGVTVTVSGTELSSGAAVTKTLTTDANGIFTATDLKTGTYTITESQPTLYNDGIDTNGTPTGVTTVNDTISSIALGAGVQGTGYAFGERGNSINGQVFKDSNADNVKDPTETGIVGVTITLKAADGVTDIDSDPTKPGIQPTTTLTDANGNFSFPNLPAGIYYVVETQPNGLGSSQGSPDTVRVEIIAGDPTTVRFADTPSSIAGSTYVDTNNNGLKDATETGIEGVTITLTGTDANGAGVSKTTTSDASGNWKFPDLLSGTYTVKETQPTAYSDGKDTGGSITSTISNDQFSSIVVPIGTNATGYLFGESGTPITGRVYLDANRNGADNSEPGIAGVKVELKNAAGTVIATTTTDANGNYNFPPQLAGTYTVVETQPVGYGDGLQNPSNSVPVTVVANQPVAPVVFGEVNSSLSGTVYKDDNNDGIKDGSEFGIPGVTVTITGTDATGATINKTLVTDARGDWKAPDLLAGTYTVTETQPSAYGDGKENPGTPAGVTTVNDVISGIVIPAGVQGVNYNFGELGTAISGVVYNDQNKDKIKDPTEPGLGGVLVTLKDGAGNDIDSDPNVAGIQPTTAITDGDGQYSFPNLPAGDYTVVETQPAGTGSSENPSNIVPVTLATTPKTVNFGDTFSSISGQVYNDANTNGVKDTTEVGLSGVTVTLTGTDANGKPVTRSALTDTNGNYSFKDLTTGTYTITETQPSAYTDGAETNGSIPGITTVNDVISGIKITAPETEATGYLFGESGTPVAGRVFLDRNKDGIQQPDEPGIPGVTLTLTPVGGGAPVTVVTDANGNYTFGNVPAGDYTITETQPDGLGSSTPNIIPVKVTAGSVTPAVNNFGDTPASLSGKVYRDDNNNGTQDAGEPGIPGVIVTVTGTDPSGVVNKTATTDADGNWIVNDLKAGTYTVTETQPATYTDGKDTNGTPTGTPANDSFSSIALTPGLQAKSYNFGELGTSINGKVFVDADKDGIQDPTEPGKPGVTLTLKDKDGNVVATTVTGPDGSYSFPNLPSGDYTITETQPNGLGSSTLNIVPVTLAPGTPGTANFGDTLSSLAGTVYNDVNGNNTKDTTEPGIAGVTVTLTGTDANGLTVNKTTTTDADGNYSFPDLLSGSYIITETQPSAYTDGSEKDGSISSSITNDKFSGITLPVGTAGTGYLFGETGTPITGTVYKDNNLDKTKQPTEPGIPGVPVVLKNAAGTIIASTVTDANGNYSFPSQPVGIYTVEETQPVGYGSSENPSNSVPVTVEAGKPVTPVNFGEAPSSLGGQVFRDDNNDGIKDPTEPGIPNVSILVAGTDVTGNNVSITTTTDANGNWKVDGLKAGTYTIQETQPAAFNDGKDTNGTPAGTLGNDTVTNITLPEATPGTGYNFGETGNTVNGQVYKDSNANGVLDPNEVGIPGVLVTLKDAAGNDIDSDPTTPGVQPTTTITDANGKYSFPNVPAGNYRVVESQPNGLGSSTPNSVPVDVRNGNPTTVLFGDTPSSIAGVVYADPNNNGLKDTGETGIAGVIVTLTGKDANNNPVSLTTTTDANGNWKFGDLVSGTYTVKETQPASFTDGKDTDGSILSTTSNDQFANIDLPIGTNATNYRFGELAPQTGGLTGVVFEDKNGDKTQQPTEPGIAGATVTIKDAAGNDIDSDPVTAGIQPTTAITDANGKYTFPILPAGPVQVVVTPPAGYVTTTPERNPQTVIVPSGGTATALPVGLIKPSIAIAKNVVQGDTIIGADQKPEVTVGSTLRYQIKISNDGFVPLSNIKITDTLPLGLAYVPGSSSLVNSSVKLEEPTVTNGTGADKDRKVLTYNLPATIKLEPGQSLSLRLTTVVTPSASTGDVINKAKASASAGSGVGTAEVNSDTAVAAVKVSLGVFQTPNVIVGRVYFDRNNDNNYTAGTDAPLPGARVYLSDGRFAVTDANGNYSIPEITPGVYAIRLDPITAPYPVKHVADDQGAPGTRYVRTNDAGGIINEDFLLLEPSAAAVKARTTTVQRGPVTLNKSLIQGGAGYAVSDKITLEKAVSNLAITDPLPSASAERGPITVTNAAGQAIKFELLDDGKTIRIPGTIPAGSYTITYAIFTALPPDQVLTDPDINYEEILLGVFQTETSRTSDEVTR